MSNLKTLKSGLFSAALAALVTLSIQDLIPNPQDASAFYLKNIYQILANQSVSNVLISSTVASPPPFSPPPFAVCLNSLWFLSLVVSLTSALLATSVQQWARRYLKVTRLRYSLHERARIRAFFHRGVERWHLSWAAHVVSILQHLSLFLFFAGILLWLWNTNQTVFNAVLWSVVLFTVAYVFITVLPIFRPESPYYTGLSSLVWLLCSRVLYYYFKVLYKISGRFRGSMKYYRKRLSVGVDNLAELAATSEWSPTADPYILRSTFYALGEDKEMDQFLESILGLFNSRLVNIPQGIPHDDVLPVGALVDALSGFLDRTFSSYSVCKSVKTRRFVICLDATAATSSDAVRDFLHRVLTMLWHGVLQSIEIGQYLGKVGKHPDPEIGLYAQCLVAGVIACAQERDGRWSALAMDQLCISGDHLRHYIAHGDSVLLANLIHITRMILRSFRTDHDTAYISSRSFPSITQFDIRHTLPELQHDFCALWNEVVQAARDTSPHSIPICILRHIRHLYTALHQDTLAAPTSFSASTPDHDDALSHGSSYPQCNVEDHHQLAIEHIP